MNYYEHHLGDYAEATAHLSFVEDAAYSRLIRKYYATERPLPAEIKSVQRLVAARTKEERAAVVAVLDEFFDLLDDGWHNRRCDAEIARFSDKREKAKRSADARWSAMPTQCEGNAKALRTHNGNNADALPTQCEGNALQSPDTNKNPPTPRKRGGTKSVKGPIPEDFTLDDDLRRYAAERLPNVDPDRLLESFRGKALAKGWAYANWRQAFQEFVRNCAPGSGHFAAGQYPKTGMGGIQWQ